MLRSEPPFRSAQSGMKSARVLVVEDDRRIAAFLDRELSHHGYSVQVVRDGSTALALAVHDTPNLIILDLGLPDMDGIEVARFLRARSPVPILVLTARDTVADRVRGLDAGADDYLVKPFALEELLARVRAMFRRLAANTAATRRGLLEYADVVVDQDARDASRGGQRLHLRKREFDLLAHFLRNPERAVTRRELRDEVWGEAFPGDSNVIEVTVAHLRRVLEADSAPRLIHTVPRIGYILRLGVEVNSAPT
jgi:two-component system, OmpR family, response regulator MprA